MKRFETLTFDNLLCPLPKKQTSDYKWNTRRDSSTNQDCYCSGNST